MLKDRVTKVRYSTGPPSLASGSHHQPATPPITNDEPIRTKKQPSCCLLIQTPLVRSFVLSRTNVVNPPFPPPRFKAHGFDLFFFRARKPPTARLYILRPFFYVYFTPVDGGLMGGGVWCFSAWISGARVERVPSRGGGLFRLEVRPVAYRVREVGLED